MQSAFFQVDTLIDLSSQLVDLTRSHGSESTGLVFTTLSPPGQGALRVGCAPTRRALPEPSRSFCSFSSSAVGSVSLTGLRGGLFAS